MYRTLYSISHLQSTKDSPNALWDWVGLSIEYLISNKPHHILFGRLQTTYFKVKGLDKTISARISINNQTQHIFFNRLITNRKRLYRILYIRASCINNQPRIFTARKTHLSNEIYSTRLSLLQYIYHK